MNCLVKFSPLVMIVALLTGCVSTGGSNTSADTAARGSLTAFSTITHPSSWYRDLFDDAPESLQQEYAVLVARSYIKEGNFDKAAVWLKAAGDLALTPLQESKVHLATAYLYYAQNNYNKVLAELKQVGVLSMSRKENANYYVLLANTQKKLGNYMDACRNYIILNQYLNNDDESVMKKNQEAILSILLAQGPSKIRAVKNDAQNELELGYYEFALNHLEHSPDQYPVLDTAWLKEYPDHPAKLLIGSQISTASDGKPVKFDSSANISHVAVIMPFSGKLATYGNAFRYGVMMAQRERSLTSSIRYYDSNVPDVDNLYKQAVAEGAQFVVGPLTKENVSKVLAGGIQVPTLAINSFDNIATDNAYFFALTPEKEGGQAAIKIRADGHYMPLLLVPATEKGDRIISGFQKQWFNFGGNSSNLIIKRFKTKADASSAITQAMSNNEIDAVYLCGSALEVSMMKTQIQVTYPGKREYYITNNSNPGSLKASVTKKMKGIQIGDMPWLLEDSNLKTAIRENLDVSNINVLIFFALGYDSISIIPDISSMATGGYPVSGLTGTISIDREGRVNSEVNWVPIE
ncbi:MAG: penicillin-binding protein activator [Succinivibrionaceae bacterium]